MPLAYDLMASKRLQLDGVVSKVKGVMLFFSAVGGVTTNSMNKKADKKKNPSKEQDSNSQEKEIPRITKMREQRSQKSLRNVIKMEIFHILQ